MNPRSLLGVLLVAGGCQQASPPEASWSGPERVPGLVLPDDARALTRGFDGELRVARPGRVETLGERRAGNEDAVRSAVETPIEVRALAASEANLLWIASCDGSVAVLEGDEGDEPSPIVNLGTAPAALLDLADGGLLVATESGDLYRISPDHETRLLARDLQLTLPVDDDEPAASPEPRTAAVGLAALDAETVYVTEAGAGGVTAIDVATGEHREVSASLGTPTAMASLDGRLVVLEAALATLLEIDPDTGKRRVIADSLPLPSPSDAGAHRVWLLANDDGVDLFVPGRAALRFTLESPGAPP